MTDETNNNTAPTDETTGDTPTPTRWTKGMQSPNPAGRPIQPRSVKEVKALAREHTHMAITTLAKICANPKSPPACRVSAAEGLLARGWGRAPTTDLEAAEGLVIQILRYADQANEIKTIEHNDEGAEGDDTDNKETE